MIGQKDMILVFIPAEDLQYRRAIVNQWYTITVSQGKHHSEAKMWPLAVMLMFAQEGTELGCHRLKHLLRVSPSSDQPPCQEGSTITARLAFAVKGRMSQEGRPHPVYTVRCRWIARCKIDESGRVAVVGQWCRPR